MSSSGLTAASSVLALWGAVMRANRLIRRVAVVAAVLVAVPLLSAAPTVASADSAYTVQAVRGQTTVGCRLAHLDLTTGVVTPIGDYLDGTTTYACATDLALSPDGGLYGIAELIPAPSPQSLAVDPVHLVRFDTQTGAVTDLGPIGTMDAQLFGASGGITFDAAGDLFAYLQATTTDAQCSGQFCLFKVDPANPEAAQLVGVGGDASTLLYGLTATCAGNIRTLAGTYVAPKVASEVAVQGQATQLDAVDTSTGAATLVGTPFDEGVYMQSLDYDATGTLWAIGASKAVNQSSGDNAADGGVTPQVLGSLGSVFTIDPATGVATAGATISAPDEVTTNVLSLAIAPLSCEVPTTTTTTIPVAPASVVVTPRFTG